jgi:hypothetical protein
MNTHHFLKFLPLIFFSIGTRFIPAGSKSAWAPLFLISGGIACLQMLYYRYKNIRMDLIAVGTNLFLIYGAAAFLVAALLSYFHTSVPLLIFAPITFLKQASIFPFILAVGIIATLINSAGFIQFPNNQKQYVMQGSLALIALVSLILLISFGLLTLYNAGTYLGVAIPFIAMLFGREFIWNYFSAKIK